MKYLLDTNIVSVMARAGNSALMSRMALSNLDDLAISIVSRGELEFGLLRRPVRSDIAERMRGLLQQIPTLTLPPGTADHYATVRHELERSGQPIGSNDLWIAAHALAHDLTVVTGNVREFTRVPGLRVENWLR